MSTAMKKLERGGVTVPKGIMEDHDFVRAGGGVGTWEGASRLPRFIVVQINHA